MGTESASHPASTKTREELIECGRDVVRQEARELELLVGRVDESFVEAVETLCACVEGGGKIITTGVGKSGLVAKRIAATMNSLGATSFFLHPVEALHGDLGMVSRSDVLLAVSKSGESQELLELLPLFRRQGNMLIALTGNTASTLARTADTVLDCSVTGEACPFGLTPTASSAAAAALGDALSVALFRRRGLTDEDFAFRHPGGALGRRLLLRVRDVMHRGDELPLVGEDDPMSVAIMEIIRKRLGMTGVVATDGRLVGIVTDGDLKRILVRHGNIMELPVRDVMTRNPRTIEADAPLTRAMQRMEEDPERLITCLMTVNDAGEPEGVIHLHDCLQAGIA